MLRHSQANLLQLSNTLSCAQKSVAEHSFARVVYRRFIDDSLLISSIKLFCSAILNFRTLYNHLAACSLYWIDLYRISQFILAKFERIYLMTEIMSIFK